jgi:hypothetical protein
MNSKPRTPKLAEVLFEVLCDSSGAVANRVSDDQNGWDLIIEFPQAITARPPDTTRPAITCLVQVKSSTGRTPSYRVKLSNALRFARHPLPCFIVKVEFREDGKTPHRWYLQHFWFPQIEKTLRTVREEHSRGNVDLNRHIITFQLKESEQVEPERLVDQMLKTVEAVPNYSTTKISYAEKVGYEKGSGVGSFSVQGDDAVMTLVDAMTGFTDNVVEVENFTFIPSRFGIPEPKPLEGPTTAKLKVQSRPVASCNMILSSPDGKEQISLPAEIYTPGMPSLPKPFQRMRIHSSILDIAASPFAKDGLGDGDVKISFDYDNAYGLPELYETAAIYGWLQSGSLGFEVWYDGKRALAGNLSANFPERSPNWTALAYIIKILRDFVPASQQPNGLKFKVADFSDMKSLYKMVGIMSVADATINLTTADPVENPGDVTSYVLPFFFGVGSVTYFGVAQYNISALRIEGTQFEIKLRNGTLVSRAVLRGSVTENIDFIEAEVKAASDRHAVGHPNTLFQMPAFPPLSAGDE